MSQNRVLFELIVAALLAATAVSLRQVMLTKAAGNSGSLDSSTRFYVAGAKAVEEQRSSASDDRAEAIRLVQARMAWAKAVEEQQRLAAAKVDRSFHTPQTSNYQSPQQIISCLDDECTFQLPDGQWVK